MSYPASTALEVAVIGELFGGHAPQDMIEPALQHSAAALGIAAPTVRWVATDDLERKGAAELLGGADAIWCAPGCPYRSLDGALEGIRLAREQGVPFLGTCAGFQHAVIEVAGHLVGIPAADHEEYGREGGDLVIHELLCSLAGRRLDVRIIDDRLAAVHGSTLVEERYYCTFGLNPVYRAAARGRGPGGGGHRRGRRPASDHAHVRPSLLRRHAVRAQTSSEPEAPHPLVTGLLRATAQRHPS